LIRDRFHDDDHHGAAAMLLHDGSILTGTAPDAINRSVEILPVAVDGLCPRHRRVVSQSDNLLPFRICQPT
jgi:hypothetical protein